MLGLRGNSALFWAPEKVGVMYPLPFLSPRVGNPEDTGVAWQFHPLLGPPEDRGDVPSSDFVLASSDPRERSG